MLTELPELPAAEAGATASPLGQPPAAEAGATASPPIAESREGQRPATILEDCSVRPCQRPGCYVTFAVVTALSPRHFCSCECRQALRNVLDREARYRRRRRAGYRPPRRGTRPAAARPP